MLRSLSCIGKFAPSHSLVSSRPFSASFRISLPSDADNAAKKYIENLYRATRSPLWHLIGTLQPHKHGVSYNALHDNNVSLEEFRKWQSILSQVNIEAAVSKLQMLGYQITEAKGSPESSVPSWIVLSLVQYKVKTAAHASGPLMDLVFHHISSAPADIRAPLLILTAYQLARFNLFLPLRSVVNAFLELEIPSNGRAQQYNAFLHALSYISLRSVENANNVHAVLRKMDEFNLKVSPSAYDALLRDEFATFLLAKALFIRMVNENCTPTSYQMESFLRIFAEEGQTGLAERFLEVIHTVAGDSVNLESNDKDPRVRANTLLLNSLDSRKKATRFIQRLLNEVSDKRAITSAADGHRHENPTPSQISPISPANEHDLPTPRVSAPSLPKPDNNTGGDLYAKTAAFHVAAKDLSTPTARLFEIFHSLPGEPNIVAYTILIRGLLARREWRKAEILFSKLERRARRRTDVVLDQEALTAGVQALTRNGKPHEAFQLLEKYATKPEWESSRKNVKNVVLDGDRDVSPQLQLISQVQLTTISMNEFLVSLNRIERPDIVFRLWDHMNTLYAVQPNATTLSILLQSARLANKKDDSLAGVVAKLKRLNPFKSKRFENKQENDSASEEMYKRVQAVDEVISCVGHPSRGSLRKYMDGVWRGMEPVDFARRVFLQALFGNDAASRGKGRLWDVESPASATRRAYDDDASSPLGVLPDLSPKKYVFDPPPDLLTPTGRSHYPSITVTNANFFNYIALLGVSSRAAEIPLTLAWMRSVGVQPSESTLALALVLWFEVSVQAPLVERWTGGEEKGEYFRLREWIEEWVGEARVPRQGVLMKWRYIVNRMRGTSK